MDDVPGVAFGTGPKALMVANVIPQWLSEGKVIRKLANDPRHLLYIDSCSGHNCTPELTTAAERLKQI